MISWSHHNILQSPVSLLGLGVCNTMSFLNELEKKRLALRKTEVKREKGKSEQTIVNNDEDYYRLMRETYFEEYYDRIEGFTFKSVIFPLTLGEIRDLKSLFMSVGRSLESVESKVDEGIASIRKKTGKDCKAFVRLSSRSPKDAIYHLDAFPPLYREILAGFQDQTDLFSMLHAFYKASTEILAVSSGKEAVELLAKSQRIQGSASTDNWNNDLIIFVAENITKLLI